MVVRRRFLTLLVGVFALTGCNYTLRAGSGLPSHIRTLAVIPFENDSDRFEVSQDLFEAILREVPRSFGVQTAGEEFADAYIRGRIRSYSVDAPSYRAGDTGAQVVERQVNISIEVQVVDRANSLVLWEDSGLTARGEFLESSELEEAGRALAVTRLVRAIIDGLQSNW
jgi:hypothetical protein